MNRLPLFDTEVLEDRARRWLAKIGGMKPESFPCNQRMTVVGADSAANTITYCFYTTRQMENPWGVTHGGMLAMALDWAMGVTSRVMLDQCDTPTIDMQLGYLHPVPLEAELKIVVTVQSWGRTVAHLRADGFVGDDDMPSVTATGTYYMRNRPLELD